MGWRGVVAALAVACTSTSPAPDRAVGPPTLAAARAREAEPLPIIEIVDPAGTFRTRAAGRLVEPRFQSGAFGVDIGSEAPILCRLAGVEQDLATTLREDSETNFDFLAQHQGEILQRQVLQQKAGALGESPFLRLDWVYRVRKQGQESVGEIKQLIAAKRGHTLYCRHIEVGYAGSFERVVAGMLEALEFAASPEPSPYYEEISETRMGQAAGVLRSTLRRDSQGEIRIDLRASFLATAIDRSLLARDVRVVQSSRPDGSLIRSKHVEIENSTVFVGLDLEPLAPGRWRVTGSFRGEPFEQDLVDHRVVVSWLGQTLAARQAIATRGVGASVTVVEWIPNVDPTRLLEETIAIRERVDADHYRAESTLEGIKGEMLLDRSGSEFSSSLDLGGVEMRNERVFTRGSF